MTNSTFRKMQNCLLYILGGLLALLLTTFVGTMACEIFANFISGLLGLTEKSETLKFLGVGMGGVLLTLQVLMSHRRAAAMEEAARAQSDSTLQHVEANRNTEQGQRQERLKNAIEHLGSKSAAVRLGGAYELVHLAQDTEDLRQTVFDILCAHIRQTTTESEYLAAYKSHPSNEIQSLLTLLFIQRHEVFRHFKANLVGSCLKGAQLREARLRGANLTQAHLQFANLRHARLQGAFLGSARLQGAILIKSRMQGAILHDARLQAAQMQATELQGAYLGGAGLHGALLHGVQLQGANYWAEDKRPSLPTFEQLITDSIDQEGELFEIASVSGIDQQDVESLVESLNEREEKQLRTVLTPLINKQDWSFQLLKDSGAATGIYTRQQADQWIAEYKEDL